MSDMFATIIWYLCSRLSMLVQETIFLVSSGHHCLDSLMQHLQQTHAQILDAESYKYPITKMWGIRRSWLAKLTIQQLASKKFAV